MFLLSEQAAPVVVASPLTRPSPPAALAVKHTHKKGACCERHGFKEGSGAAHKKATGDKRECTVRLPGSDRCGCANYRSQHARGYQATSVFCNRRRSRHKVSPGQVGVCGTRELCVGLVFLRFDRRGVGAERKRRWKEAVCWLWRPNSSRQCGKIDTL